MNYFPVTFKFLSNFSTEERYCPQRETSPLVSSDHASSRDDASDVDRVLDADDSQLSAECVVNFFRWSKGRCRFRVSLEMNRSDSIAALRSMLECYFASESPLMLFRFVENSDGVLPIAVPADLDACVGNGGVFGCNVVPRSPGWKFTLSLSFSVFFRDSFSFVAPPMVFPVAEGSPWKCILQSAFNMLTVSAVSRAHLMKCDIYELVGGRSEDNLSLTPFDVSATPDTGRMISVCLGVVRKGGHCTLHLPFESVPCFISDVHVGEPFLSVTATSLNNDSVFPQPWIFDILL